MPLQGQYKSFLFLCQDFQTDFTFSIINLGCSQHLTEKAAERKIRSAAKYDPRFSYSQTGSVGVLPSPLGVSSSTFNKFPLLPVLYFTPSEFFTVVLFATLPEVFTT